MFSSPFNKTILCALSYLPMHTTTCSVPPHQTWSKSNSAVQSPPPPRDVNSGLALKRLSMHFVEPKGSLPCLQESASKLYPRPNTSSPHPSNLIFLLILYSYSSPRIWSNFFPSGFPNDTVRIYPLFHAWYEPLQLIPLHLTVQVTADYAYQLRSSSLYPFLQLNFSLLHPTVFSQHALLRKYQSVFVTPCDRPYFMPT
jgi:hypothetical protein